MEPSAGASPAKRIRKGNFSDTEVWVLVDGVEEFADILFTKFNTVIDSSRKTKGWRDITERINAISSGECIRTPTEIKKKWQDLKKSTKALEAKRRRLARATGGGPPPTELPPINQRILQLIPDIVIEGVVGGIDSDTQLGVTNDAEPEENASPSETNGSDSPEPLQSTSNDTGSIKATVMSDYKKKKTSSSLNYEEQLIKLEETKVENLSRISSSLIEISTSLKSLVEIQRERKEENVVPPSPATVSCMIDLLNKASL